MRLRSMANTAAMRSPECHAAEIKRFIEAARFECVGVDVDEDERQVHARSMRLVDQFSDDPLVGEYVSIGSGRRLQIPGVSLASIPVPELRRYGERLADEPRVTDYGMLPA
jgi:hypothetical protein